MNETTVDKQHMDALKALAETTMEISRTKERLAGMESAETSYLVDREKRAMERIQKVHDDSATLLQETQANYAGIFELLALVSDFSNSLVKSHETFTALIADFNARNEQWDANCSAWEARTETAKSQIRLAQAQIESGRSENQERKRQLNAEEKRIIDERNLLQRNLARLKAN